LAEGIPRWFHIRIAAGFKALWMRRRKQGHGIEEQPAGSSAGVIHLISTEGLNWWSHRCATRAESLLRAGDAVALVMELGGAVLLELSGSGRRPGVVLCRTYLPHDFGGVAVKTRRMFEFPQQGFELGGRHVQPRRPP